MAQVAERDGRNSVPENILGQVGQGSEQHDQVEGVSAYCRGRFD